MKPFIYDHKNYQKAREMYSKGIDVLCPKCKSKLTVIDNFDTAGTLTIYCPNNYNHAFTEVVSTKHFEGFDKIFPQRD